MKFYYKKLNPINKRTVFRNRFYKFGKNLLSAWGNRHIKILIHAEVGGKSHLMEKGHVNWNRKGRW